MKTTYRLLICAVAAVISFCAGRVSTPVKEVVRYVKGETVYDSIPAPFPVKEYVPADPDLIVRRDTIYTDTGRVIVEKVDTAAIIKDYITKRQYAFNVFDNECGVMNVDSLNMQYNRLTGFYYSHTPIQKIITRTREPAFTPFVSGSYNTFGIAGLGGGFFYKNTGIEYNYLYNIPGNQAGHMIGLKVAF